MCQSLSAVLEQRNAEAHHLVQHHWSLSLRLQAYCKIVGVEAFYIE
jgi:hypothetical protein